MNIFMTNVQVDLGLSLTVPNKAC